MFDIGSVIAGVVGRGFFGGSSRDDQEYAEWKKRRENHWAADQRAAATGKGKWVAPGDVYTACNVADRLYRTADGTVKRATCFPLQDAVDAWFFPDS